MDELKLNELRNNCLTNLYSCTENISKYLANKNEKDEAFDTLRTCVIKYCELEHQEDASKKAMRFCKEEADFDDWSSLKYQFDTKLAHYTKNGGKFKSHSYVKELEEQIKRAKEIVQDQGLEQDVAITQATDRYVDPISLKPIRNPIRNTICKHIYEKKTIGSILSNEKNRGCPYVGCTNKQTMRAQHLELDEELQLTIRRTQQPSQVWEEEEE